MFRSSSAARGQRSNFTRKIFRGIIQGKTLSPSGSYHISLNCETCNTADVVRITKEVANIDAELVLTDSSGFEIVDSVATRGIEYWKTPARKFFVVTRDEYRALMVARNPTRKRQAEDDLLSEVDDKLSRIIANAKRLWVPDISSVRTIQETFSCAICKCAMQQPVYSSCCQSILGCGDCLERVQEQCPKCRSTEVDYTPVRGLDAVISSLQPLMNMPVSSQDESS
ncbi:uncharacterized protein LOC110240655 [Exaiptasia diaphana]|uniref:RING-type domain-containing protein n=2 Tax=Exaiptasia diaphana TaxID=2652724 RepID=A0A913XBX6_EXADI|nr:uncharacterized protein LOC110240655 [Exaiptasia diaphana]